MAEHILNARGNRFNDVSGKRFGRLTAVHPTTKYKGGYRWLCRCDCGHETEALVTQLTSRAREDCGYKCALKVHANRKHGLTKIPEYGVWNAMIQRCTNPKVNGYKHYGGRGIRVCDRWLNSFEAFYEDMGCRPKGLHTIDRDDPDRGYEPGNCHWVTWKQQQRNRRNNRLIEFRGEVLCLAAWAERLKMKATLISGRLKRGWSIERTLTTPKMR